MTIRTTFIDPFGKGNYKDHLTKLTAWGWWEKGGWKRKKKGGEGGEELEVKG